MRVQVMFFAALAARLGRRQEELELPGTPTAADVHRYYHTRTPEIGNWGESVLVAVNAEFCDPATPLHDNDEVALLPPMSGGSGEPAVEIVTLLARAPLPPPPDLSGGRYGAIVTFEGTVRNHTPAAPGREVVGLDYECYERMAERQMRSIAQQAAGRWPLTHIHMAHRLGHLSVGEVSVRIVVASPHRADAFAACRFLIDTLKNSVPIWKREHFTDGTQWAEGEFPDPHFLDTPLAAHKG
jgi:molybdopterin synthase catalytic subunit